ncbi:Fis family transcriptional regulator [Desulfolithobacter dissulfuricans]|uniref:Fis family transcriptional regulator n=1 Tax=Desulfolithobacter dissulfuricans TaxID=2795293 RepID=A0A915TZG5_9BACT|nr:sigma-54 dependent transcriptional regulator [Desulfolithobacter dissulfuricans]BCO08628.1 Fis family transcriptional regulator [Desulfolithobacter dissulfuricans]
MDQHDLDKKVLIVDDELDMLRMLAKVIAKKCGVEVETAPSAHEAMVKIESWIPDVVITDIKMPGMDGLEFLEWLTRFDSTITTIIMTGYGTIEMAVRALKEGAYDFFEKPFENEKIVHAVTRAMERTRLLRENLQLQQRLTENQRASGFVGKSRRLCQTLDLLARLAPSNATVLIRGESGTGKELAARALHAMSKRGRRRMVTVNCPALPEHILESELFGYRKGAFTGADSDKDGLFLEADGSTILLDEIADIPISVQTKLLRVLQEKEIQPLGQTRPIKVDVRVLASTNQDLEAKIERGEFREDLFYRLNVMTVTMPTLAEIVNDIPLLAQHFLELYSKEYDRSDLEFTPEALQCLMRRTWKGNIRELQNAINQAVLLCSGTRITPGDLISDSDVDIPGEAVANRTQACFLHLPYKKAKEEVLSYFTSSYLTNALTATRGNVSAAARQCGMERQAFQRLMRRHGIKSEDFR